MKRKCSIEDSAARTRPIVRISDRAFSSTARPWNTVVSSSKCRICLQTFVEPYMIFCGHTFCRQCIIRHLETSNKCPYCEVVIDLKKHKLVPNFTAEGIIKEAQQNGPKEYETKERKSFAVESVVDTVLNSDVINLNNLKEIRNALEKRQNELLFNNDKINKYLVREFLGKMIEIREKQAEKIGTELSVLRTDMTKINNLLNEFKESRATSIPHGLVPETTPSTIDVLLSDDPLLSAGLDSDKLMNTTASSSSSNNCEILFPEEYSIYRRRISAHLSSLEAIYLNNRFNNNSSTQANFVAASGNTGSFVPDELDNFSKLMRGVSMYTSVKKLATLNYCTESQAQSSIVSSIEFDKDGEFFVIAGVTKRIKLFDYNAVVNYEGENCYPRSQLTCNAKISNISWNPYHKFMLACSDYLGAVQVWDTLENKATRIFLEHERRAWTVQFNNVDPHLMASGSDDAKVKLWNIFVPNSILTIDAKVNVCCVHFSPKSKNHLVFGSADHFVHLYDIRNASRPVKVFDGHKKAVSYVKYVSESEVASASTDSTLRLWDVNSGTCKQLMHGHLNEKNFVGLSSDGQHVICGSENNRLYLYYKHMADPLLTFDFGATAVDAVGSAVSVPYGGGGGGGGFGAMPQPPMNGVENSNLTDDFVSAVCWKKNSNVILAANSQGTTHVLQLK